jgi:hypothetical protein
VVPQGIAVSMGVCTKASPVFEVIGNQFHFLAVLFRSFFELSVCLCIVSISHSLFFLGLRPFFQFSSAQITVQTDRVSNIPCGTSGGVMLNFEYIEVINRIDRDHVLSVVKQYGINYDQIWIYDRIHHLINQFCSGHTLQQVYIDQFSTLDDMLTHELQAECDKWNTGIQIIAARVTKPNIPLKIMNNYELVEVEKANVRTAEVRQKLVEKQAETEQIRAEIEARQIADVSRITAQKTLLEKQTQQKIAAISNQMHLDRQAKKSEADFYQSKRLSESNSVRFTPAYIAHTLHKSIATTPKVFFGKSITDLMSADPQLRGHLDALDSRQPQ